MTVQRAMKAAVVAAAALTAATAQAQETVVWWDFLGGGDGVRMKKLIEDFNAAHQGEIAIDATTLEWGVPFYSKVQTSVAVGEAPDMMTYHASRIPLAVDQGVLSEITAEDWEKMGLGQDDFAEATWDAVTVDGKQYAVPLDTHPIVLYYNKDLLDEAGVLDGDGPPGLDSREGFTATLQALKDAGVQFPLGSVTADGNFMFRTVYSLMCQQGGELHDRRRVPGRRQCREAGECAGRPAGWTQRGAAVDLHRLSGDRRALHLGRGGDDDQRRVGGPDDDRPRPAGQAVQLGRRRNPGDLRPALHLCRQPCLRDPQRRGMPPEKRDAVLEVISWMHQNSLFWATAGHIPAYAPVTESDEYQAMEPNATYSPLTEHMIFDPEEHAGGRRRADLRRDVDLLRADAQRRDGPGRGGRRDQVRAERPLTPERDRLRAVPLPGEGRCSETVAENF